MLTRKSIQRWFLWKQCLISVLTRPLIRVLYHLVHKFRSVRCRIRDIHTQALIRTYRDASYWSYEAQIICAMYLGWQLGWQFFLYTVSERPLYYSMILYDILLVDLLPASSRSRLPTEKKSKEYACRSPGKTTKALSFQSKYSGLPLK